MSEAPRTGSLVDRFDPAFRAQLEELLPTFEALGQIPVPDRLDVPWLRTMATKAKTAVASLPERIEPVARVTHQIPREDGSSLEARMYQPAAGSGQLQPSTGGPVVIYTHGGGMIIGDVDTYDLTIARYVERTGTPVLALDYRLAPEFPYPSALEDTISAVHWVCEHAGKLGVDRERVALMGDSGGACLSAAAALYCRDNNISLASQILLYPMLDDRTQTPDIELDALLERYGIWSHRNNSVAWQAVIGSANDDDISPYAAPARATDFAGLPRTYIDVGSLDIFAVEAIRYATQLVTAGVRTELHVYPGMPHAFDVIVPQHHISQQALTHRCQAISSI